MFPQIVLLPDPTTILPPGFPVTMLPVIVLPVDVSIEIPTWPLLVIILLTIELLFEC
jgi:hypothetical protein